MRKLLGSALISILAVASTQDAPSHPDPENAGSPTAHASQVLTLSETEVTPGQEIEVAFDPPPEHEVWGVGGELWQERGGRWKRIAWTWGWAGKPRMSTYWPDSNLKASPAIGFGGSESWQWKVPPRLEPGNYELRKEWLPEAPAAPNRPRVTERAPFTVVAG